MTQQAPPRIGVDSWVAEADERREGGRIRQTFERVPPSARFGAFLFVAALVPLLSSNEYVIRVGVDTLIFSLLALGLNVVVGFSGLLDLGYIAFYGFGAYMYALIASDKFGIHWPAEAALPVILLAAAASACCSACHRAGCSATTCDRDAVLRIGVRHVRDQRKPADAARAQPRRRSDRAGPNGISGHRPARLLRPEGRLDPGVLLRLADHARDRRDRAPLHGGVAHRPRVEGAARIRSPPRR